MKLTALLAKATPSMRNCRIVIIGAGLLLLAVACHAPAGVAPKGEVVTVDSPALGHPGSARVYLPRAYSNDSKRRYPLVVLIVGNAGSGDGSDVAAAVASQAKAGKMAPVILVAVALDDAARRLAKAPVVDSLGLLRNDGEPPDFHRFLVKDLLPALEDRYRTDGTRELIGAGDAGLLVVDVFFSSSWWFDRWVAIDPTLEGPGAWQADGAGLWLRWNRSVRARWLLVWSDNKAAAAPAMKFTLALETGAGPGLDWDVLHRPDADGADVAFLAAEALTRLNPPPQGSAIAPSRPPENTCAWKSFASSGLGIRLWVPECRGPDRYEFSAVENRLEQHRPEDDRIFGSHVALEMFRKPAGQPIEDALREQFIAKLPPAARQSCKVERIRRRGLGGNKFLFTLVPTGEYREQVLAELQQYPRDFGCGEYGKDQDDTYFEYHPDESRTRFAFVVYGTEEPLFDERTVVFEGP